MGKEMRHMHTQWTTKDPEGIRNEMKITLNKYVNSRIWFRPIKVSFSWASSERQTNVKKQARAKNRGCSLFSAPGASPLHFFHWTTHTKNSLQVLHPSLREVTQGYCAVVPGSGHTCATSTGVRTEAGEGTGAQKRSQDDHNGLDARSDHKAWGREHTPRSSVSWQGTHGMRPAVGLWAEEAGHWATWWLDGQGGAAPPVPGPLPAPHSRFRSIFTSPTREPPHSPVRSYTKGLQDTSLSPQLWKDHPGSFKLCPPIRPSLVAQTAMPETWIQHLGGEDPLEKGMTTHSSLLAWRIPIDRGAWRVTVHGVTKSRTQLSDKTHTHPSN